jgi:hypothetical protein
MPKRKPAFSGDFTAQPWIEQLNSWATSNSSISVFFEPLNLELLLWQGTLVGASGVEPLGEILVRRGIITEQQLYFAMRDQLGRSLGEVLQDEPFQVSRDQIVSALEAQIVLVLQTLFDKPPAKFSAFHLMELPSVHPSLSVNAALVEARGTHEGAYGGVFIEAILRLNPLKHGEITLSEDEWRVCSLVNGRRNLRNVIRLFQISDASGSRFSAWSRAHRAATRLFEAGWLEYAAVHGLRTIVLRHRKSGYEPHPKAQVFLEALDGQTTAAEVAARVRLEPVETARILTALLRDDRVAIVKGQSEIDRLLEEY